MTMEMHDQFAMPGFEVMSLYDWDEAGDAGDNELHHALERCRQLLMVSQSLRDTSRHIRRQAREIRSRVRGRQS
mgnify:FL=1